MIITVGNTKGGVGKPTLAVNLAIARALTGRDVWLIDGDRQGTAQAAISIRAEAGHTPGIASKPIAPRLRRPPPGVKGQRGEGVEPETRPKPSGGAFWRFWRVTQG